MIYLNITQFGVIQDKAEDVVFAFRKGFGFPCQPPIPVEMIARDLLGLKIVSRRLEKFGNHTFGALSVEEKTIYVDDRCNWHQRLFTIAHEIGHWMLHRNNKLEHIVPLVGVSDLTWPLSSSRTSKKNNREKLWELEANRFAEALLIPRDFLYAECKSFDVINIAAVYQLKKVFDVSVSTIVYRIKNLYEHLEWAGPQVDWDSISQIEQGSQPVDQITQARVRLEQKSPKSFGKHTKQAKLSRLSRPKGLHLPVNPNGDRKAWGKLFGDYLNKRIRALKEAGNNFPFIVEFAGTPNAGKDTLIEIIKDYLTDGLGYRVRVFDEGIKSCHIDKDMDIDRLYKTIALSVVQLYDAKYENPGDYDIIIFNRGIFDRLGFLQSLHSARRISDEQEQTHRNYLLSYANLQDMTFLILISPEESLHREMLSKKAIVSELIKDLLAKEEIDNGEQKSKIHTISVLSQLNESYVSAYWTYKANFNNQVFLDDRRGGKNTSIRDQARLIIGAITPDTETQSSFPELFGTFADKKLGRHFHQLQLKQQAFFHTQDYTQLDLPL